MTSEAERRDEATKATNVTTDVTPQVTPDVTAEETGASAGETARADEGATTTDMGAKTADMGAATVDEETTTATASALSAASAPSTASTPAAVQPATPVVEAVASPVEPAHLSPLPTSPQQEGARIRHALETIKTAVVWLIVIQILTILSPLLRVSLKWMLLVGLVLTLGSFAVGVVAYLKAQRAQSGLPE
jgi:hypothetical protein